MSKIGVGIVTYNREKQIEKVFNSIDKNVVDEIVIVNDTPEGYNISYPEHIELIQHEKNQGVGISKNHALKYLMDKKCDHLFLMEDDVFIKNNEVFNQYIKLAELSGLSHFNFGYHGLGNMKEGKPNPLQTVHYGNMKMAINKACVGAFSYYQKKVIQKVGYFDEKLINCWEHVLHTYKIIQKDFHPHFWNFPDLEKSFDFIGEIGTVEENSVITLNEKHDSNIKEGYEYIEEKYGVSILEIKQISKLKLFEFLQRKMKK